MSKPRTSLTKKELESIYFPNLYENREVDIDGNMADLTYILKFDGRYYKLEISVCVNHIDDDWYIYEYHISERENDVTEVVPKEVKTIVWEEV